MRKKDESSFSRKIASFKIKDYGKGFAMALAKDLRKRLKNNDIKSFRKVSDGFIEVLIDPEDVRCCYRAGIRIMDEGF